MGCEITDPLRGAKLFEQAVEKQSHWIGRSQGKKMDGLLDIGFLLKWLREELVARSDECSMEIFREVLDKVEISLPRIVITDIFYSGERTTDETRENLPMRRVRDLEDRLTMYLSLGACKESVVSLIQDEVTMQSLLAISSQELKLSFQTIDSKLGDNGYLEPQEVLEMLIFLAQDGMSMLKLLESLKRLGMRFPERAIRDSFMAMDTNGDDNMDLPEFLGLFDYIIMRIIPQEIIIAMGYSTQQILAKMLTFAAVSSMVLLFVGVSLSALQVNMNASTKNAEESTALIRGGLGGLAVFALKRDTTEEDKDRFFRTARARLYDMLGVTESYVNARRRNSTLSVRASVEKRRRKRESEDVMEANEPED